MPALQLLLSRIIMSAAFQAGKGSRSLLDAHSIDAWLPIYKVELLRFQCTFAARPNDSAKLSNRLSRVLCHTIPRFSDLQLFCNTVPWKLY